MAATSSPIIPDSGANLSAPGGQSINLATGEIWTCPVRLTASQKIYFRSAHASANFRILIGQLPG